MYIFKHWRYGYHSLFVNNVVWSNIFVPEKKVYSVDNFLITQYCVNKLATAILNKFLFVTFNAPGSQEPFSTPPGSPDASDNAPRVTSSHWQRPPGHQEPVTTPPRSPGASDNALQVTRSQWQCPSGHQEPASTPRATRTQCLRPRATRSHWEHPQTTESQRPYQRVARCSVNASGPPRGNGYGHCRFSPLQSSCSLTSHLLPSPTSISQLDGWADPEPEAESEPEIEQKKREKKSILKYLTLSTT